MSSYADISSKIETKSKDIENDLLDIKKIDFASVWSGDVYETLSDDLDKTINKVKDELKNFTSFSSAMEQLESYKTKNEEVKSLQSKMNDIVVPSKIKDPSGYDEATELIESYKSQIQDLEDDMEELKKTIQELLSSITSNEAELTLVSFELNSLVNLDFDVATLYNIYKSGRLGMLSSGSSLYDYYDQYDSQGNLIQTGKEYVEGIIKDIQSKYSGREAAVNCGLALLKLASDKGIKINYEHSGTYSKYPYVRTSSVASGVDCNPYVSWCIDKGVEGGFQWRPVGGFTVLGDEMTYGAWSQAQPGDVLANGRHVSMIIENNPETGELTYMHASGTNNGITITKRSYSALYSDNYTLRDMTNVYNGNYNTDRWQYFAPHATPETFVRNYV